MLSMIICVAFPSIQNVISLASSSFVTILALSAP